VIMLYLPTEIKMLGPQHWSNRLLMEAMGYGLYVSGLHRYGPDMDIVEHDGKLIPVAVAQRDAGKSNRPTR